MGGGRSDYFHVGASACECSNDNHSGRSLDVDRVGLKGALIAFKVSMVLPALTDWGIFINTSCIEVTNFFWLTSGMSK